MIQDGVFWIGLFAATLIYWLLPAAFRRLFLAALSLAALLYYDVVSSGFLLAFSALLYATAPAIARDAWYSLPLLLLNVTALLLPLIAFKSAIVLLLDPTIQTASAGDLLVPLGMSYYVFRLLHIALDSYRRKAFEYSFQDYACYVFLFTIIVAGPIQRFDDFLRQASHTFIGDHLLHGGTRIAFGLIKQTFVIDTAFWLRDKALSKSIGVVSFDLLGQLRWRELWVVLIIAYVTSYLNLSAYTDIAIGSSRLFGFTISENFRWPVAATSITDFWRRWHMTLTNWCQTYVYFPVLGWSRNPSIAIAASFLAIGLWHVLTLNRVAWGCFHAAGVIGVSLWRKIARKYDFEFGNSIMVLGLSWLLTQAFVSASWIFVLAERSNDVGASMKVLLRLFGIG